jgi:hypothetical protein
MTMPTLYSSTQPFIRAIALIAQEEPQAPLGERPDPNRPIGFASVFLMINNPAHTECCLVLRSLSVVDALTGEVMLHHPKPQTILLMPLENTTIDVHLNNHTGYGDTRKVRAIAQYQSMVQSSNIMSSPTSTIESDVAVVTR